MKKLALFVSAMAITLVSQAVLANPVVRKYCARDAQQFCAEVPQVDVKKLRCLVQHGNQLSPNCRVSLEVAVSHIKARAASACRRDARRYCGDVAPGRGRILRCLSRYSGQLNSRCASIVARLSGHRHVNDDEYNGD